MHACSYSLEKAHLLEVWAGVGKSLLGVCEVVVSAEVKAIGVQHTVDHTEEHPVILRLERRTGQCVVSTLLIIQKSVCLVILT